MKRKEDPRFIRGKGNYVDDVKLPGMLYLDIVRSPYAHAKIMKIDTAKALDDPRRPRRDHRQGPRQVQPALDADADVGHADGPAGREGDVPGAGGRGGDRHRAATPRPTASTRSRSSTSRCRWSSIRFKALEPGAPVLRTDKKDKKDNHIWHWEAGDRAATDAPSREADGHGQGGHLHPAHPRRLDRDLRLRRPASTRSTGKLTV